MAKRTATREARMSKVTPVGRPGSTMDSPRGRPLSARCYVRPLLLACAMLAALGACAPTEPEGPPPLLAALPRPLSPAELRIADATNGFAFGLLREVTRELPAAQNAFLSPLSAS